VWHDIPPELRLKVRRQCALRILTGSHNRSLGAPRARSPVRAVSVRGRHSCPRSALHLPDRAPGLGSPPDPPAKGGRDLGLGGQVLAGDRIERCRTGRGNGRHRPRGLVHDVTARAVSPWSLTVRRVSGSSARNAGDGYAERRSSFRDSRQGRARRQRRVRQAHDGGQHSLPSPTRRLTADDRSALKLSPPWTGRPPGVSYGDHWGKHKSAPGDRLGRSRGRGRPERAVRLDNRSRSRCWVALRFGGNYVPCLRDLRRVFSTRLHRVRLPGPVPPAALPNHRLGAVGPPGVALSRRA
jgi:hypothetical protein